MSVVIPARDAAGTLPRTLRALAAQDVAEPYEVIVVDDGSGDATPDLAAAAGAVRLLQPGRVGAAEARNVGVGAAGAPLIAFTDADCFPAAGWLRAGLAALAGADLVQGRVVPDPEQPPGPFDRTLRIESETGLFETANLLVRRELFDRIGGFEDWLDTGDTKLLAEDVWFGWRAVRAGARTRFADDALVHHAVFRRGPGGYVAERMRLRFFPAIVARVPELRRELVAGLCLSPNTAAFDAAVVGLAAALVARSALPLVAAAPYAHRVARGTLMFRRRAPLVFAARVAADAVGCIALVTGSARHRSPVV